MASRRLVAIITAMLLLGGSRLQAEIDLESLRIMNELIDGQRWDALRQFLRQHPEAMIGEDALAQELRYFFAATEGAGNRAYAAATVPVRADGPDLPVVTGGGASEGDLY